MLLKEIWETCNTERRHETSRLKQTRAEENVITVDRMVGLPHKPEANISFYTPDVQTYRSNKV